MNIGDSVSKAIKEGKWLNISYINKSGENTFYWIAVKDIIANSDRPHDDFYTHFQFGDDYDIMQLCIKIIDDKIKDLSK